MSSNPDSSLKAVNNVSRETHERLTVFADLLKQWQSNINLIAPSTVPDLWERHIEDSLQYVVQYTDAGHWLDLGSGAGLPGMIAAIVLADAGGGRVELVESVGKKCAFLRAVVRETGLKQAGVEVIVYNDRIENVLSNLDQPDIVSARALASLDKLLGFSGAHIQGKTIGLFPKGRDHQAEIDQARRYWNFDCDITKSELAADSVLLKISNVEKREN